MIFSKVVGSVVDIFRNGTRNVLVHKSQAGGKAETSLHCIAPGFEINPANGEYLVLTKIKNSNSFTVSIGGVNQDIEPDVARGERRVYSVDSGGDIAAKIKWLADGTLELNGATDSAVLFSKLKSAFDELKSDFNELVNVFNLHTHAGVTSGTSSSGPPASSGSESSASVDSAESADVKLS